MIFQLDTTVAIPEAGQVVRALQALDPFARVDVDPSTAVLRVKGQLGAEQVLAALAAVGIRAERAAHVSGGSTCCGSCS